jgi:hypothetical protein
MKAPALPTRRVRRQPPAGPKPAPLTCPTCTGPISLCPHLGLVCVNCTRYELAAARRTRSAA